MGLRHGRAGLLSGLFAVLVRLGDLVRILSIDLDDLHLVLEIEIDL